MADDLYERYVKAPVEAAAKAAFQKGLEMGEEIGFEKGMRAGQALGFVAGVRSVQDALSEGTRMGSSKCGKALEAMKRLGIDGEE